MSSVNNNTNTNMYNPQADQAYDYGAAPMPAPMPPPGAYPPQPHPAYGGHGYEQGLPPPGHHGAQPPKSGNNGCCIAMAILIPLGCVFGVFFLCCCCMRLVVGAAAENSQAEKAKQHCIANSSVDGFYNDLYYHGYDVTKAQCSTFIDSTCEKMGKAAVTCLNSGKSMDTCQRENTHVKDAEIIKFKSSLSKRRGY